MKTKERIKTVLLIVLLIGAVFLTYSTWFFDNPTSGGFLDVIRRGSGYDYSDEQLDGEIISDARFNLYPLRLSFKNASGRFAVPYDAELTAHIYDKSNSILRIALTKPSVAETTHDEWIAALGKNCVLFDFEGLVPISVLATSVGAPSDDTLSQHGRYLLISEDGLFFKNPYTATQFRISDLPDTALVTALSGVSGTPCRLAYEAHDAAYKNAAPETVVTDIAPSVFTLNCYSASSFFGAEQLAALLKILGLNYSTCGNYTEQNGTLVFTQELNTVKVAPDGLVTYTDPHAASDSSQSGLFVSGGARLPSDIQVISSANHIIAQLDTLVEKGGDLYIQDTSIPTASGERVIRYGLSVDGVPIDRQKTGYCAEVATNGRRITKIVFYMRSYERAATSAVIMPKKIAAASLPSGGLGLIGLRYTDGGQASMAPEWYIKTK